MKFKLCFTVFIAVLLAVTIEAEILPGQAVSWSNFSYITCIAITDRIVYFGTTEGILRYSRMDDTWLPPFTQSDGLPEVYIQRMAVSFDDGWITVETPGGVYTYSAGLKDWSFDSQFPVNNMQDSRPPEILPQVFMPFNYRMEAEGYISDPYLRKFNVTAWKDDDFSTIYIGSWGLGPLKADDRSYDTKFMPYGLLQKSSDALYLEGDSLWIAGNPGEISSPFQNERRGVTLFEFDPQSFTYFEPVLISGFDSEVIYAIGGDDQNIYFAGQNGLTVKSREKNTYFTVSRTSGLPGDIATAVAFGLDSVWVGSNQGLALYRPSVDEISEVGRSVLGDRFITDLLKVNDLLIIGTDQGSYYINTSTRKLGRLSDPEGVLRGEVRDICGYGDEIYVATSWGVTSFNTVSGRADKYPLYQRAGGAYAVAVNDKYVAVAIEDGLLLIERDTKKSRTFDTGDGLLSIRINALVPDGDFLWIGSEDGLTRFKWVNPERVD